MKTLTTEQKAQLLAHIEANQPEFYWDYNDELSKEDIIRIFSGQIDEIESEIWENNIEYIDELERECINNALTACNIDFNVFDIDDQYFELREYITVDINIKDLLKRTEAPVRLTLRSNYDCMNSNYYENRSGYEYGENYFTDMLKFLQINPAELQKSMNDSGFNTIGEWPNITGLNPIIDIQDFLQELANNCGNAVNFIILGKIKLSDISGDITGVICRKGTYSGLYDESYGSGSLLECSLIRDFEIDLTKTGATEYDKIELIADIKGACGYCTDEIYGLTSQCFKKISII